MKKMLFVLLALCLFVVPAMAQTQDNPQVMDWEDMDTSELPYNSSFYHINDLGIQFLVPDGLEQQPLSEADEEDGIYAAFTNEDYSVQELILLLNLDVDSLEELILKYIEDDPNMEFGGFFKLNGLNAIMAFDTENDKLMVIIPTDADNTFVEVSLKPMHYEDLNDFGRFMVASIAPYSLDTEIVNEN